MNHEADERDSFDELPGDLRAAIECLKRRPIPDASLQRALDRARRCGLPVRRTAHRVRQKAVLGFAAAVAACIALGLWFSRPSDLWADVVKAVQAKPWIHGTLPGAKPGQSRELWLSTSRAVGGSRIGEEISFFDDRLQITYRYEPQEMVLYRLPSSAADLRESQQLLEIFQGLFRGDTELKAGLSGVILKNQKRRQMEKDGRHWDECELHFQTPSRPDADFRMTFFVDAQTRLPHSMTMRSDAGESVVWTFDYPANGPADVYALGVPKDAKLVDRVPTGDMSRILAGIQAGRDRFDDFHAIVVQHHSPDMSPGPGQPIPVAYLVWKKGNRWRVEAGMPSPEFVTKRIPPNKDEKEWVREGCKHGFFRTANVCDGKAVYGGDMQSEGMKRFEWLGTADQADFVFSNEKAIPSTWCYPIAFNAPNVRTEETVNPKPLEGPPNTILVTSRLVHPRVNEVPFQRFWLDPERGYAVVRHDILHADPAKPRTDRDFQFLMGQWEQTPNGVWYPARVGAGSLMSELKTGATWYHFFLDFPADMPDELFKPAKRTVLTNRYPVGS